MSIESPPGKVVRLSTRELEVARLVAEGLTNREIAAKLFLSERTVDGHLEHIREKLGVGTRAQVTAWVVRQETAPGVAPVAAPRRQRLVLAHPRAWLAAALVVALLAVVVGVLRLSEPPPPTIRTVVGVDCQQPRYPGGCFEAYEQRAIEAKLSRPTSIAVDRHGVLYIADYGNGLIRKVEKGVMTTMAGGGTKKLEGRPFGRDVDIGLASTVAVDGNDQVLILTAVDGELQVWKIGDDDFMQLVVDVGKTNPDAFAQAPNLPVGGLAISPNNTIFIADRGGNRVWKFDGTRLTPYAGAGTPGFADGGDALSAQLHYPIGLALDRHENLYIADAENKRIREVDHLTGTIRTVAGSGIYEGDTGDGGKATQALLSFPFDVAVNRDGSFVIADTGNHRLRLVAADGTIIAYAGTGRWGFEGDGGAAIQAEFNGPEGLAVDSTGDLFIADTENQRVREIPHAFAPQ